MLHCPTLPINYSTTYGKLLHRYFLDYPYFHIVHHLNTLNLTSPGTILMAHSSFALLYKQQNLMTWDTRDKNEWIPSRVCIRAAWHDFSHSELRSSSVTTGKQAMTNIIMVAMQSQNIRHWCHCWLFGVRTRYKQFLEAEILRFNTAGFWYLIDWALFNVCTNTI